MSHTHIILASFLVCTLMGLLTGCDDAEIHEQNVAMYCDMVAHWKSDEALGVPEVQRDGWPEHPDKPYSEVCMSNAERIDAYTMAQRAGRE